MQSVRVSQDDIVRPYQPSDKDGCLAIFDSNIPRFFAASEREEFERFLDGVACHEPYLVIKRDGRPVACGGTSSNSATGVAEFCWGMVDRKLHGTGLGRLLTEVRLRQIADLPHSSRVLMHTSQHTRGFYLKFGFEVLQITADGYGPGLDRYDMVLQLGGDCPAP